MASSALNLLAVGIFALALLGTFGPALGISPVVPAATVGAVLAAATADTLAWQGRGALLLRDGLTRLSPQHRERVVRHEAGHFLVAYFLGIPITGYTLSAWEALRRQYPGVGGVAFDTASLDAGLADGREVRLLLDRFCAVWMAGQAAERKVYGDARGGGDDRARIRAALGDAGCSAQACQRKERWATLRASELLEQYWRAYEVLVAAMAQRAPVEECCRAIQAHCPGASERVGS